MDGALFAGVRMSRSASRVLVVSFCLAGSLVLGSGQAIAAPPGEKSAAQTGKDDTDYNLHGQVRLAPGSEPLNDPSIVWALHKIGRDGQLAEWDRTEYGAELGITVQPGRYLVAVTYGNVSRSVPVAV